MDNIDRQVDRMLVSKMNLLEVPDELLLEAPSDITGFPALAEESSDSGLCCGVAIENGNDVKFAFVSSEPAVAVVKAVEKAVVAPELALAVNQSRLTVLSDATCQCSEQASELLTQGAIEMLPLRDLPALPTEPNKEDVGRTQMASHHSLGEFFDENSDLPLDRTSEVSVSSYEDSDSDEEHAVKMENEPHYAPRVEDTEARIRSIGVSLRLLALDIDNQLIIPPPNTAYLRNITGWARELRHLFPVIAAALLGQLPTHN